MARYRVLSWRGIPAQVRAQDEDGRVTVAMPDRFQQEIDRIAMRHGLADSDAYLEGWTWSSDLERPGSAADVAAMVVDELIAAREREA
jgi:hypothetical protein